LFNPNKTFGGEKSKFNIFPLRQQMEQIPSNLSNYENNGYQKKEQVSQPK
jgi:hypothetical protein